MSASAAGEVMHWLEVRAAHPGQWLVIEALDAHSENDRVLTSQTASWGMSSEVL
jgi:hypothetical protein